MKRNAFIAIVILAAIGIAGRLLPHLPNATPIAALAFIGSTYFGRKTAILLPLAVLFITDAIIGFYSLGIMVSVYASFTLIAILSWYAQKQKCILTRGYMIMFGSVSFFIITNATVWWLSPWYEKSLSGLLYSYELGLPFLRNMLLGDVVYTFTLLGTFATIPYFIQISKNVWISKTNGQTIESC